MRICYLGDCNVQVRRVAEYFAAAGHDVHIVTARPREIAGIPVHSFAGALPARAAFLVGLPAARRCVASLKPDLIHAFYATSYGLVASGIPGPPVALSPMGTDVLLSARDSRISAGMVQRAIRRAGLIFSVAPHMTRRLVELGAEASRIRTFPRGVDLDKFVMPERRRDTSRPVILSNRKLEAVYNIEQMIRAAPRVIASHPGARFVIQGEGSLRQELEALARSEGVASSVIFEGAVDHDRVPESLARADIFVSCSRSDGASVSLLEAMASGLYPIVSDIEANRSWIGPEGGGHGDLVPLDDPEALARAIGRAIDGLAGRQTELSENRALIMRRANWSSNMPLMEEGYRKLAGTV